MIIGNPPLFDFIERSKAAETGKVIVEAAISNARGWNVGVDITHLFRSIIRGSEFDHIEQPESRKSITRTVISSNASLRQEFGIRSTVSSVTAACCGFQSLSIEDRDLSTSVVNDSAPLKCHCCGRDSDSPYAKHVRHQLVCHAKSVLMCAVVGHQQPTREALIQIMKS
jgi:hypothetical protein